MKFLMSLVLAVSIMLMGTEAMAVKPVTPPGLVTPPPGLVSPPVVPATPPIPNPTPLVVTPPPPFVTPPVVPPVIPPVTPPVTPPFTPPGLGGAGAPGLGGGLPPGIVNNPGLGGSVPPGVPFNGGITPPVTPPVTPPGPPSGLPTVPPTTPGIPNACSGPAALHNPFCTGGGNGGGGGGGGSDTGKSSTSTGGSGHHKFVVKKMLWKALGPALVVYVYMYLLNRDLTEEQLEAFPGQEWDTCANSTYSNPVAQCYEQRNVMSPYLWKAPHHKATGRTDSFLHRSK